MAEPVQMDDWAVVYAIEDPYCPPESAGIALKGVVTGHHKKSDGTVVRTSRIVEVKGHIITTESGTVYKLGEPSDEYRAWLAEHRPNWNPQEPVVLLGRETLH